jgi:membrane-associated phospholipid phosphatase
VTSRSFNAPAALAGLGVVAAVAAVVLTFYILGHPYIPQDATVERDVQAVDWGPLTYAFQFFSWIGDAKGFVAEAIVFLAVLAFNRRSWLFAAVAALTGAWYVVIVHLVNRPRPTTAQVLRVTEHPGASSYPSGHTIFIVTVTVVLMVCLGYRFLPGRTRIAGWIAVALVVVANGIGRTYTGAHWPTDVIGGFLIAVAWLSFAGVISASLARRLAPSASRIRGRQAAPGEG